MVKQNAGQDPVTMPHGQQKLTVVAWIWAEVKDHLLPWGPGFLTQRAAIKAAGIGLTVVMTVIWMLAAVGHIDSVVVIAWCNVAAPPRTSSGVSNFDGERTERISASSASSCAPSILVIGVVFSGAGSGSSFSSTSMTIGRWPG